MPRLTPPWEIKRRLLIKSEKPIDPRFGSKPEERPIEEYLRFGVINLDKPPGPSSHEVTAWVKRLLALRRAGHGGTLDPKVTGILPIALEDATKIVQALQMVGKEYICVMRLHRESPQDRIESTLAEFVGPIYQRPPVRSSVKRRLRTRTVYYLKLLEIDNKNVLFQVGCEAGTYIRKLCHDIGEVLRVGAHMQELRRIRSGPFTEKNAVTLHDIAYLQSLWQQTEDAQILKRFIQPMENVLESLPKIIIRDSAVGAICHGANLAAPGILSVETAIKPKQIVALLTQKGEGVALAKVSSSTEDIFELDHGLVAKTIRVLMPRDVYPKLWSKSD